MVRIASTHPMYQAAGYDPTQALEQDPRVIAARAAEQAQLAELDRQLRAAREQAIIQFGDVGLASLGGFNLDPSIAALVAQANASGNTTTSRLKRTSDLRRRAIINNLAGVGMINSGDTGYLSSEEDKLAGSELFDARQQMLNMLRGVQSQDLSTRGQLRNQTLAALNEAYKHRIENPELYGGTVPVPAPVTASTGPDYYDPNDYMPVAPAAVAPRLPNRPVALPRPRRDTRPYRFRSSGRGF